MGEIKCWVQVSSYEFEQYKIDGGAIVTDLIRSIGSLRIRVTRTFVNKQRLIPEGFVEGFRKGFGSSSPDIFWKTHSKSTFRLSDLSWIKRNAFTKYRVNRQRKEPLYTFREYGGCVFTCNLTSLPNANTRWNEASQCIRIVYPFHFEHAFLNKNESFITLSAPIWSKRHWEPSRRLFHSQLANCHILLTQSLVQRIKASCKLIEPNPRLSDRFRRAKRGGSLPPGAKPW